jgi:hypothetical protein
MEERGGRRERERERERERRRNRLRQIQRQRLIARKIHTCGMESRRGAMSTTGIEWDQTSDRQMDGWMWMVVDAAGVRGAAAAVLRLERCIRER